MFGGGKKEIVKEPLGYVMKHYINCN